MPWSAGIGAIFSWARRREGVRCTRPIGPVFLVAPHRSNLCRGHQRLYGGAEGTYPMSTSTPTIIRSVPRIMDNEEARDQLRDGFLNAIAALQLPELSALHDAWEVNVGQGSHPDVWAWERLIDRIVDDEILPQVDWMLHVAITRHLPWEAPRG